MSKSDASKLYQKRYHEVSSEGWDNLGVVVRGGDTVHNSKFRSSSRVCALPFLDGVLLAALGGICATASENNSVAVLIDAEKQAYCATWAGHKADFGFDRFVVSLDIMEAQSRFNTPITSTGANSTFIEGAVECSLFTVILTRAIYDVLENGLESCDSSKYLVKSWVKLVSILPDSFLGNTFPPMPGTWKMEATPDYVRDAILHISDAAWVHLGYFNSGNVFSARSATPMFSEITTLETRLNSLNDLAPVIRDESFLSGLYVSTDLNQMVLSVA